MLIMQGFIGFSVPLWVRRIITIAPACVVALCCNAMTAMILSQVVLSFVLPLPMIALVVLSGRKSIMGEFVQRRWIARAATAATIAIMLLNILLIRNLLS